MFDSYQVLTKGFLICLFSQVDPLQTELQTEKKKHVL